MTVDVFYFGCWAQTAGHYLRAADGSSVRERTAPADWPIDLDLIDARLLPPKQPQTEGLATFVHINGWTIISFWDRSADSRRNSNSAFLARGLHSFDEIRRLAQAAFPSVWDRFKFEVTERK